ncbi:hypothetical protein R1flu_006849 [Riccia fluitans]|uniref:Uncharacterized protein n=1 Tax=Riccia fluitans TaxID=41844 RepID=A0ABD1YXH5_9MARC
MWRSTPAADATKPLNRCRICKTNATSGRIEIKPSFRTGLSTPLLVSLQQARREIEASFNNKASNNRWLHGIKALEEINKLIKSASRSATRPIGSNEAESDRPSQALGMTTRSSSSNETEREESQASANSLFTHRLPSRGNETEGENYQALSILRTAHPNSTRESTMRLESLHRVEHVPPPP